MPGEAPGYAGASSSLERSACEHCAGAVSRSRTFDCTNDKTGYDEHSFGNFSLWFRSTDLSEAGGNSETLAPPALGPSLSGTFFGWFAGEVWYSSAPFAFSGCGRRVNRERRCSL